MGTGGRRRSSSGLANSIILKELQADPENTPSPFYAEKLTSAIYNKLNPPKAWYDVSLLVPHEGIRHEMNGMVEAVAALKPDYDKANTWRSVQFAKWYIHYFYIAIHSHHDNEELIYFPFIATRAKLPETRLTKDHEELVKMLDEMKGLCDTIIQKKGMSCSSKIKTLQAKVPSFVEHMEEHLQEEEATVPPLLRDHFTVEEEQACVAKIIEREGITGLRTFFPAIVLAMREWAAPAFMDEVFSSMPPPIRGLFRGYYLPVYEQCVRSMRDAPLLKEKPALGRKKLVILRKFVFCC